MLQYKKEISHILGIKSGPNKHELYLFNRGQKYIRKLTKIPGIEMIAICNSLSMYATHRDSDIDLFIVTKPGMIWFVRFFVTIILWMHGVWRKNQDIRENFCLSFFVTTDAMDLQKIAINNDIYLYYWIYHMKPIYIKNNTYAEFLEANKWVEIDSDQKSENQKYIILPVSGKKLINSWDLGREIVGVRGKEEMRGAKLPHPKGISIASQRDSFSLSSTFNTFGNKSTEQGVGDIKVGFYTKINQIIRFFLLPRTLRNQKKLGYPEGVIISDDMLKFHDKDRRKEISDTIFKKNFDK